MKRLEIFTSSSLSKVGARIVDFPFTDKEGINNKWEGVFSYLATDKTKFVLGMHNTYGNGIERAG